jgi:hypothetical protein
MIIIQVLLGGITRLTGSGLSITEWKPIMGALPPMIQKGNDGSADHSFFARGITRIDRLDNGAERTG